MTAVTSTINTILLKPDGFSRIVIPYAPTFLGFLVFLKWNGGIVLGPSCGVFYALI